MFLSFLAVVLKCARIKGILTKRNRKKAGKITVKCNTVTFLSLKVLRKGGEVKRGEVWGERFNFIARG